MITLPILHSALYANLRLTF